MAATDEMLAIAKSLKPEDCCLVPERRAELTTEGGLDVVSNLARLREVCGALADAGIRVSLFVDPDHRQLDAAVTVGAPVVEIHTGRYADAETPLLRCTELQRIQEVVAHGREIGLQVNAGHGLDYHNVRAVALLPGISELNIGFSIIARALFEGLGPAVGEMKRLLERS
ncbi:MAG: pyridoxine 5'-phosphate synthase, partial [Gammaproteobacteria bacterium]|nr:pyridoxine 5'-phosphate synthase [Gammaproteobacteria bacterium]